MEKRDIVKKREQKTRVGAQLFYLPTPLFYVRSTLLLLRLVGFLIRVLFSLLVHSYACELAIISLDYGTIFVGSILPHISTYLQCVSRGRALYLCCISVDRFSDIVPVVVSVIEGGFPTLNLVCHLYCPISRRCPKVI